MKPSSSISLLRHGETIGGARFRGSIDDPLNPTGWDQMCSAVGKQRWDHIISSPLVRCADFADSLAAKDSISIEHDERIKEMHFGSWEGCTAIQLMERDADALGAFWNDPLKNTPPQAEKLLDFQARVLSAWQDVVVQYRGQHTLLVTHGGVIRIILCHLQQHPVQRLLELEVGHASLTRISHKDARISCRKLLSP
ncbi:Alpha-ribazole-5'-phosphate phosphatase [hydrothermal vent metagenome]|uniref:Alpha-ribazole-5'-phosphate phosphatase n=1 Tax=hydrothermal vent metagenome TaxID=652676 RepID=A0A3B0ZJU9_9ZZZZ